MPSEKCSSNSPDSVGHFSTHHAKFPTKNVVGIGGLWRLLADKHKSRENHHIARKPAIGGDWRTLTAKMPLYAWSSNP
jgi:hypothetical protein